jgi:hypothetical protein
MNIPDHISEILETIFWIKILKLFDADVVLDLESFDPGSGKEKNLIRDKTYRYRIRNTGVNAHLENPFHYEWAVVPGVRSWTLVDKGAVLLGQGEVFRVRTKADGPYVSVGPQSTEREKECFTNLQI